MFKTETHLHTGEVSPCGKISAAEMVRLYHEAGYKTVIVSDHLHEYYVNLLGDIPWADKIDHFLSGYKAAKAAAKAFGMHVILAAELTFNGTHNDYLLYGIDEAFLKARPDVLDMTAETFYPYAKAHGVTVVQAHPYRDNVCTPTPLFADALEVHNSNPRHENFDEKAIAIAKQYGKPMTAGSDAHRLEDATLSGVITAQEICTATDYVRVLLNGELQMIL